MCAFSLDHLVCEREKGRWNLDANRLCGADVDQESVTRGLLEGQFRWPGAFEDAIDLRCSTLSDSVLSRDKRLVDSKAALSEMPVTVPPGCARLVTKPVATGSPEP